MRRSGSPQSIAEATKTWFQYLGDRERLTMIRNRLDRAVRAQDQDRRGTCRIIGPRPRKQKVIMCHGVFDVVHPGHLRHLIYAKSKADILVASLTADAHIARASYRPHVPQDLRALNLAAFEMVDYVHHRYQADAASKNISKLQPDFFAKGYEYTAGGLPAENPGGSGHPEAMAAR